MTGELKDVLAGRTEDEEAMCAVCSGGLSVAPNLIVFCERCDIAVHQRCYGVDDIPAGLLALCTFCSLWSRHCFWLFGGWQLAYSVKIRMLAMMHVFPVAEKYFQNPALCRTKHVRIDIPATRSSAPINTASSKGLFAKQNSSGAEHVHFAAGQ